MEKTKNTMEKCAEPVVVTSLNPGGNIEYQLRCFSAWQRAGFLACSVNIRGEAEQLENLGVAAEDVIALEDGETARATLGKPVPSILPVLYRVYGEYPDRDIVLTNSDIYPAIRSSGITRLWRRCCGGAAGLTREECHAVEAYTVRSNAPYRGGLDTFFIANERVPRLLTVLNNASSGPWMAFGAVGWDYLMGAAILSSEVGGSVMDGAVLIHRAHRPTYGNVDAFERFAEDLQALGFVSTTDGAEAAHEFSLRLKAECERNRAFSRMVKQIFFRPVRPEAAAGPHRRCAARVHQELVSDAPGVVPRTTQVGLGMLTDRLLGDADASFGMVASYLIESPSRLQRFVECLMAIVFALRVRQTLGPIKANTTYPPGNRHAEAVKQIVEHTASESPQRRLEVACLFGAELVDHGLFNPCLYDYLVFSTENEHERRLLRRVVSNLDVRDHAA